MIDLAPQYLKTVTSILAALVPAAEVRAFGSRVTWTAKSYSDLDIAIVGRRKLTLSELSKLSVAFEESDLPVRVDVLDWHAISPEFQEVIRQKYEVIQEGVKAIREKGERYTQYGLIPGGWNEGVLGDFITLQRGFDLPEYERYSGEIPVVTSSGISDFHNEAKVKAPGVVMGRYGTLGKIFYIADDFWPHNTTLYVKDFKGNDPRFFSYFLKTLNYQAYNDKSSVPGLNRNHLHLIPVLIPPLPEQRAIAEVLGSLDDKIELNRRMNATLEEMARAVFKHWFVDNPEVEEWELGRLGDVITNFDSKRIPLSHRERAQRQGKFPYYGAASVMDYIDDYLFDGVYVLMAEDGSVIGDDDHPVLQYVWGRFWVNNHAHILKGTNGICDEHLYLFLREVNILPYVTGAVQPKLNQANMNSIPFTIPPEELCKKFEEYVSPLFAYIRANQEESRTLASLRDTLLPKLMSGEVRVQLD